MRVLISGAAGFVGPRLVERLAERHEVVALSHRPVTGAPRVGVRRIVVDLNGPLDLTRLPETVDAVVHLAQANVPFPEQANALFTVNAGGAQQLLDYARRAGAQTFVTASSGDVYGERMGPCHEDDLLQPGSFYGVTKYASELMVRAYAPYLRPCILRLFQPYGPGQQNRLVPRLAERIGQGQVVFLNEGDHPRVSPTYVDDVVTAFERAIEGTAPITANVAGDERVSFRELAEAIGRVLDRPVRFEPSGRTSSDLMGDNARMKQVLGSWPLVSLAEGLARTLVTGQDGAREEAPR
jgi:nucleoside-diphosphate-sugar epimerase